MMIFLRDSWLRDRLQAVNGAIKYSLPARFMDTVLYLTKIAQQVIRDFGQAALNLKNLSGKPVEAAHFKTQAAAHMESILQICLGISFATLETRREVLQIVLYTVLTRSLKI